MPVDADRAPRRFGPLRPQGSRVAAAQRGSRRRAPRRACTPAAAGAAAAGGFSRTGGRDFTAAEAVTIDDKTTREIDDALSIAARADGGFDVAIHIADPSAFLAPGDPIDVEARARGTTYYF